MSTALVILLLGAVALSRLSDEASSRDSLGDGDGRLRNTVSESSNDSGNGVPASLLAPDARKSSLFEGDEAASDDRDLPLAAYLGESDAISALQIGNRVES